MSFHSLSEHFFFALLNVVSTIRTHTAKKNSLFILFDSHACAPALAHVKMNQLTIWTAEKKNIELFVSFDFLCVLNKKKIFVIATISASKLVLWDCEMRVLCVLTHFETPDKWNNIPNDFQFDANNIVYNKKIKTAKYSAHFILHFKLNPHSMTTTTNKICFVFFMDVLRKLTRDKFYWWFHWKMQIGYKSVYIHSDRYRVLSFALTRSHLSKNRLYNCCKHT